MRVLIGHASAHGSTREIALRIAGVLKQEGLAVDALPISRLGVLDGYDAAVLGSAIHQQAWLPEAMAFVQRHASELVARPVWLFSVGMSASLPPAVRTSASKAQDRRLAGALRDLVRPRGHRLFSGVAREEDFPRWTSVLFRLVGARFGDFRDWDQIEDWAREIAHDVRSARLQASAES
ncbi:flavodoxin domain-containing protein [Arthrobacter sulfonylureivorans]|uniref:Flavodoxin n=1 Tax=Arthrobacter sulfonylureivorans TaxID=2486855 RepID=A0ABY3W7N9_9MICC|nr:flavodoxin domain-containing protein [Arthrobacter sulfonylureivorans]UNK45260.1 flavodoxin [Arthrobacter sulfonylureivorans]